MNLKEVTYDEYVELMGSEPCISTFGYIEGNNRGREYIRYTIEMIDKEKDEYKLFIDLDTPKDYEFKYYNYTLLKKEDGYYLGVEKAICYSHLAEFVSELQKNNFHGKLVFEHKTDYDILEEDMNKYKELGFEVHKINETLNEVILVSFDDSEMEVEYEMILYNTFISADNFTGLTGVHVENGIDKFLTYFFAKEI